MFNKDLVSVVIPTYNSENYISHCLEATINQTYTNIEIIIVDDESNDSTIHICQKYAENDDRIKVFGVCKNGVSGTRNYGIAKANGRYIVFFDADDRPERSIIECYIDTLHKWQDKNIAFVACGMFYDNLLYKNIEDKVCILELEHGFIEGEIYLLKRSYAAVLAWLKIFNFVTNKIYDLNMINKNGIHFDENIHIGEDLKFNLDYLDACTGYIGIINKPLYHYIKRSEDSLSFTYHDSDVKDTKAIYKRFLEWELRQNDVTEDNIRVVQSIYITDWTSRLATKHDYFKKNGKLNTVKSDLNREISSSDFQYMLGQVYKAKKISTLRYLALRTRNFDIFCFLRSIYQKAKG